MNSSLFNLKNALSVIKKKLEQSQQGLKMNKYTEDQLLNACLKIAPEAYKEYLQILSSSYSGLVYYCYDAALRNNRKEDEHTVVIRNAIHDLETYGKFMYMGD